MAAQRTYVCSCLSGEYGCFFQYPEQMRVKIIWSSDFGIFRNVTDKNYIEIHIHGVSSKMWLYYQSD